jgi:hypothetical protein
MTACPTCGAEPCANASLCTAAAVPDATHRRGNGQPASAKPLLIIDSGSLPRVAEQLRDILAGSGALYDRGMPVRITLSPSPVASPLSTHTVVRLAHQYARPVKNGEPATLPDRVANMYLDMQGEWQLSRLAGISASPLLLGDGGIKLADAYDLESGIYCHGVPQVTVPAHPTPGEAGAALQIIRKTFCTFPFGDSARRHDACLGVEVVDLDRPIGLDESAFLSGLMTAVCRQSLWLAPGVAVNAPSISGAGSGKGLLVRAIGIIAYGVHVRPFTPGNDRHEMDKRLVAEIIEAKPIVAIDNVNSMLLRSNTLASLLTERPSGVRILGHSRMVTLEHASLITVTGNGLTLSEDLARRFLFCELDARCEDPEQRPFKDGFLDEVQRRRSTLLAAALTIWRWGRQLADDADAKRGITLGSYEQWGRWVRDPLLALGCPDPVARVRQIKERDPARQHVIELFHAWWEAHRDAPVRVSDLAPPVRDIADPNGRGRQYVARAIQNLAGTRQGGFLLDRVAELPNRRKEGARYHLKQVVPLPAGQDDNVAAPKQTFAAGDQHESSASSASFVATAKSPARSKQRDLRMRADDPADAPGIHVSSAPANLDGINNLAGFDADDADDADASAAAAANGAGRCDYCGAPATHADPLHPYDWPGRPDGISLHRRCEEAWLDAM